MLLWLMQNASTIAVGAVILVIVACVLRSMIVNKKKGRTSCGCGCEHCAMSDSCHAKK